MATGKKKLLYIGKATGFSVEESPPVEQKLIRNIIMKDLNEFVVHSSNRPDDPLLSIAVQRTFEMFQLPQKVKIIHLNDIFNQDLDIWTKSAGLPWKEYGYKTKGDLRNDPDAIRRVRKFAHLIKNGEDIHFPDCLTYVRSHTCKKDEYKERAEWEYPATVTFIEAMFALPLIRGYQNMHDDVKPIAYGFETATESMKIYNRFTHVESHYIGIDFKKFAQTVPPWLIDIAFDILLFNINIVEYEDHGIANAKKLIILFYALKWYFIETTFQLPNGLRFRKFSGITSGSYFTELVGSVVNCVLINWLSLEQFRLFPLDCIFLGENSLISSTQKWDLHFCNEFVKKIGMEINIESPSTQILNEVLKWDIFKPK